MRMPCPEHFVRPPDRIVYWFGAAFLGLLWLCAVVRWARFDATTFTFSLLIGFSIALLIRIAQSHVVIGPDHLSVQNPLSSFRVKFSEIDDVEVGSYLTFYRVVCIRVAGRLRPLFAIHGRGPRWVGSGDQADVELRRLQERVRGHPEGDLPH